MKNTIQTLTLAFCFISATKASAAIVCELNTEMGPARVEIEGPTVKVTGAALKHPQVFKKTANIYDGHMTSLITAPGLAISYHNTYGCIRDAKITTNFREDEGIGFIDTAEAALCTGGSTPDNICQPL